MYDEQNISKSYVENKDERVDSPFGWHCATSSICTTGRDYSGKIYWATSLFGLVFL